MNARRKPRGLNRAPFLHVAMVNAAGVVGMAIAWLEGWPQRIVAGDGTGISFVIGAVLVAALALAMRIAYMLPGHHPDDRFDVRADLRVLRFMGSSLVMLGLIGTVAGAAQAFLGLDPQAATDPAQAAASIGNVLTGVGTAVYTTLAGAVLNLWVGVNATIVERYL